jgi:hypothetical protein
MRSLPNDEPLAHCRRRAGDLTKQCPGCTQAQTEFQTDLTSLAKTPAK